VFREFYYDYESEHYIDMARSKTPTKQTASSNTYKKCVWANIKLSSDDEPEIIERSDDHEALLGGLLELFDGGFSVSIKRRDDNNTVQISITGTNITDPTVNIGLSAFATDIWTAMAVLLFK